MGIRVNENDYKRLITKLHNLEKLDKTAIPKVLSETGKEAERDIKRFAPVDTGRLKTNVEAVFTKNSMVITSEAIDPVTKIDYAPVQEYGGKGIRAKNYFAPPIHRFINKFSQNLNEAISRIINKK